MKDMRIHRNRQRRGLSILQGGMNIKLCCNYMREEKCSVFFIPSRFFTKLAGSDKSGFDQSLPLHGNVSRNWKAQ